MTDLTKNYLNDVSVIAKPAMEYNHTSVMSTMAIRPKQPPHANCFFRRALFIGHY